MPPLQVTLVYRKPLPSVHSIEYLFHNVYAELRRQIAISEKELPCYSKGFVRRVVNTVSLLALRRRVVHLTGDCHYALLGALFAKRVLTIHDLSFLERTRGWRRRVLKLFWVTLPVRMAHRITVVSETTRTVLASEAGIAPQQIQVVYNFIDPIYKPVARNFNRRCPRILQVGTAFNKNIPRLAQALAGIPCVLVIVGRLDKTQVAALEANGIRYENYWGLSLDALHQQYLEADLLSFVSTVEGFGMPILEAQACGLPVLSSNCSAMPEVAGGGALLVNPLDVDSILQGLRSLITDGARREALVAAGYLNVRRFTKEKVARDYLAVYQSL